MGLRAVGPDAEALKPAGEGTLRAIPVGVAAASADPAPLDDFYFRALVPARIIRLSRQRGGQVQLANVPAGAGGDDETCLAQAVYFEARSQSLEGQEAVAQVVMNRKGKARYADTVCGVVYQGSQRATGCQFTFTCDGSLRAPEDAAAWDRARDVARKALAGYVYTPLEGATHYHAAYVTPYWSSASTRIRRIGAHIFYR
jgi:spore germination cell wall hydrolase CwlJ-like protein